MTKKDAAKLLELIQLSYPNSYKNADDDWKLATINMWAGSFPDVPYPIMEQAFNHFRMQSEFPPKVAEMVQELKNIHYHATECALIHKTMGNEEEVRKLQAIMQITLPYKDGSNLGLQLGRLPNLLTGGESNVQSLGTPGDHLCIEDRLPLMDAGR